MDAPVAVSGGSLQFLTPGALTDELIHLSRAVSFTLSSLAVRLFLSLSIPSASRVFLLPLKMPSFHFLYLPMKRKFLAVFSLLLLSFLAILELNH